MLCVTALASFTNYLAEDFALLTFIMVRRIICSLMNPYGPNCTPARRRMCNVCNDHFRSGGSQRRHQCLCGFTTRCMRELINHIICQQYVEVNDGVIIYELNVVDGDIHRITCVCLNSIFIVNLMEA